MELKPVIRSTSKEKLPEASATAVCSPFSEIINSLAVGVVEPDIVMLSEVTRASSSGVLMVSWLLVRRFVGVGEGRTVALGEG